MISLLFYYAWHDVSKWNLVSGFDRFSHWTGSARTATNVCDEPHALRTTCSQKLWLHQRTEINPLKSTIILSTKQSGRHWNLTVDVLRRACSDSFVAEAQVRIAKQPRGAITELGGFRRKNHAPGVFSCPPNTDSVDTWKLSSDKQWLFAAGVSKVKIMEIWRRDSISRICWNCFALIRDGSRLRADEKPLGKASYLAF